MTRLTKSISVTKHEKCRGINDTRDARRDCLSRRLYYTYSRRSEAVVARSRRRVFFFRENNERAMLEGRSLGSRDVDRDRSDRAKASAVRMRDNKRKAPSAQGKSTELRY